MNKQHNVLTEIGRLLIEAQIARMKNTVESCPASETEKDSTADEPSQNKSTRLEDSKSRRVKVQTSEV